MNIKSLVERFGGIKLFFLAVGLLFLFFQGVFIFFTPSYEIMYNHHLLPVVLSGQGEMRVHILELGNTGGNLQDRVDILLASDALTFQAIPLQVRNFGKVDRKVEIAENDATTRISLGALEPEKRVELRLCLFYQNPDEVHAWDEIFKGIETEKGKTVVGDPKWTTLVRILYDLFGSPL
ncbi:MAG: hypothetical protein ABIK15_20715 [Pseudomonadota bacterium]